jgi:hypothetical protein
VLRYADISKIVLKSLYTCPHEYNTLHCCETLDLILSGFLVQFLPAGEDKHIVSASGKTLLWRLFGPQIGDPEQLWNEEFDLLALN